ncbi:MAG TPA: flagellar filament capping protein FliD [Clostridiales bacterium]|nr:flagellar filament capping protein FliD [Clostridiales bacterium]
MNYYSVNNYSSIKSRKGIGGLMSGLDVDSIVEQLTLTTRTKIQKQLQQKQLIEWKQEAYREIINKLSAFQNKYLSSTSSSNILKSTFFNVTTIENRFSDYVKVSGSAANASNIVITSIDRLATNSQYVAGNNLSAKSLNTGAIREQWSDISVAGQSLEFKYNGKTYSISLDSNSDFKKTFAELYATDPDVYGNQYGEALNDTQALNQIAYIMNKALGDLKSKYEELADVDFNVEFTQGDGIDFSFTANGEQVEVTGGSSGLFGALGYEAGSGSTPVNSVNVSQLYQIKSLGGEHSVLAGASITVSLNGVAKVLTFEKNDIDGTYNTVEELRDILQAKLDKAFGAGKVIVTLNDGSGDLANGSLSFTTADPYSVFQITGSTSSAVLSETGALRVGAFESNRANLTRTLGQYTGEDAVKNGLATALTANADGKYRISVNGHIFTFSATNQLGDIISRINNANIGVKITYSSTTDRYTITATDGGTAGKIEIKNVSDFEAVDSEGRKILTDEGYLIAGYDENGNAILATDKDGNYIMGGAVSNLSEALFGASEIGASAGNLTTVGEDAVLHVSFDGNPANAVEIVRSSNSFVLDDVSFELKKATTPDVGNITFTVNNNTDQLFDKIKSFVDEYNEIISLIYNKYSEKPAVDEDGRRTYLPLSEEQAKEMTQDQIDKWNEKAKQGLLYGDSTLNSLLIELRRALNDTVAELSTTLAKIGITTGSPGSWTVSNNNSGQLVIDEEKLRAALASNPQEIIDLFTRQADPSIADKPYSEWTTADAREFHNTAGIAHRIKVALDNAVGTFGITGTLIRLAGKPNHLSSSNNLLSSQLSQIGTEISRLRDRLKSEESRWFAKFTMLETYLSSISAQSEYLSSLLYGRM